MKQLELQLNKRLLIVEPPEGYSLAHFRNGQSKLGFVNLNIANPYDDVIDLKVKGKLYFVCNGPDFTEEVAEGFVQIFDLSYFVDYNGHSPRCYVDTALEAFISAIESKNYHWGENPYQKELDSCNAYTDMFTIAKRSMNFEEAESRTFKPEKCIIFEIL